MKIIFSYRILKGEQRFLEGEITIANQKPKLDYFF